MIDAKINTLCWTLFGVVWILGMIYNAIRGPKVAQTRSQIGFLWPAGAIVVAWVSFRQPAEQLFWQLPLSFPWAEFIRTLGIVCLLVCTGFTLWSRFVLGKMWSSAVTLKEGHQLHTAGPYSVTRHPIYTGILGMALGSWMSGEPWAGMMWLIMIVIFTLKMRSEEKLMIETFGDAYRAYQRRVPQFIPGMNVFHHEKDG
ncbi:isoprenylcysteine carboxylmethyltransferase family protein [Alicyclobacillaceae bacterium I2511]|nr:isoprenylcysteine carboxylmethyltransferase family protein [Alicyclobacillaceae bacterium I2511]